MRYDGTNLKEVLEAHGRWMKQPREWPGMDRANFTGADLEFENLSGANLRGAIFERANLRGANLERANLADADLSGATLFSAVLSGADLESARLARADLRYAKLESANLSRAYIGGADFEGAHIKNANFENVLGLRYVCLYDIDIDEAQNFPSIPMACPDSGAFTAWKQCESERGRVIVKLMIPEDAKRLSATGRKCRASKAEVLEIQTLEGEVLEGVTAWSMYDCSFMYEVGKTVRPEFLFEENRWEECESGIHFFINRQEAVDY